MPKKSYARAVFLVLAALAATGSPQENTDDPHNIYSTRKGRPSPMDTVLLRDYQPDSSLVVEAHHPAKPTFPAIDMHAHPLGMSPQGGSLQGSEQVANWVRMMDETGVESTVVLTGMTGERFDKMVELYLKPYPKRFIMFCGIDATNIDAPDYPERAARELERCHRMGARGVGELADKGSGIGQAPGGAPVPKENRLHPDDPRLDLVYKKMAELKMPFNLHMADHPSAWRPPDNHQERVPFFQIFNQYGRDVPSYEELLRIRDHTMERHPEVTFILCHFGNQGNDMAALSRVMDKHPNMTVDISARDYEFGREPLTAAKFMTKYKDRVLFGTDLTQTAEMYRHWWRMLETHDEYIPGPNLWRLYGLGLPAPVLKAIYRGNAKRILNWN